VGASNYSETKGQERQIQIKREAEKETHQAQTTKKEGNRLVTLEGKGKNRKFALRKKFPGNIEGREERKGA